MYTYTYVIQVITADIVAVTHFKNSYFQSVLNIYCLRVIFVVFDINEFLQKCPGIDIGICRKMLGIIYLSCILLVAMANQ